jgi:hypothetical protein
MLASCEHVVAGTSSTIEPKAGNMAYADLVRKQEQSALRGSWRPHASAGELPDAVVGEAADTARELFERQQETSAYFQKVKADAQDARAAHESAESARAAAVVVDAENRGDGSLVQAADEKAMKAASWSRAAVERVEPAEKIARVAGDEYQSYVSGNAFEFVSQLRTQAEEKHAEWVKAYEKARAIMRPLGD